VHCIRLFFSGAINEKLDNDASVNNFLRSKLANIFHKKVLTGKLKVSGNNALHKYKSNHLTCLYDNAVEIHILIEFVDSVHKCM